MLCYADAWRTSCSITWESSSNKSSRQTFVSDPSDWGDDCFTLTGWENNKTHSIYHSQNCVTCNSLTFHFHLLRTEMETSNKNQCNLHKWMIPCHIWVPVLSYRDSPSHEKAGERQTTYDGRSAIVLSSAWVLNAHQFLATYQFTSDGERKRFHNNPSAAEENRKYIFPGLLNYLFSHYYI